MDKVIFFAISASGIVALTFYVQARLPSIPMPPSSGDQISHLDQRVVDLSGKVAAQQTALGDLKEVQSKVSDLEKHIVELSATNSLKDSVEKIRLETQNLSEQKGLRESVEKIRLETQNLSSVLPGVQRDLASVKSDVTSMKRKSGGGSAKVPNHGTQ